MPKPSSSPNTSQTTDITTLDAWKNLSAHAKKMHGKHLKTIFVKDNERFTRLSVRLPSILADFSKNRVTEETISLLTTLADARNLGAQISAMFSGAKINNTEDRAVLHTALRAPENARVTVDGQDVILDVHTALKRMEKCADDIRSGAWRGHTGKEITDIVNIGIGGSVMGPQLATQALAGYAHMRIRTHYISNVEASEMHRLLKDLSPDTTLFIIASKSFTTVETMQNATIARDKLVRHFGGDATAVSKHFVALAANTDAVKAFGIPSKNMFPLWGWVGGRYSVWSAIGLSTMISIGPKHFREFLAGAHEMDMHFKTAPLNKNIPALMGLIGLWYRNFLDFPAYTVVPYHSGLARLPAWLQQADMESNGKHITSEGTPVTVATGPCVFGEPGTDSQHTYFQWLHQGTDIVPVDFIAAIKTPYGNKQQQSMLLANCLAQSEALMNGQDNTQEPYRHFEGNRPSTTILLDELTPHNLGMLLAAYEHRVFVQGAIWGINSFDQFGVELGKALAKTIQTELTDKINGMHDASTSGLIHHITNTRG
ncbi:MAG: glucose-6-phosphate isomerase [Alphaproteobacteria bacterium]|nr:glucose-6-phosphate isomerase [Alphaproteobacteria bacterium]